MCRSTNALRIEWCKHVEAPYIDDKGGQHDEIPNSTFRKFVRSSQGNSASKTLPHYDVRAPESVMRYITEIGADNRHDKWIEGEDAWHLGLCDLNDVFLSCQTIEHVCLTRGPHRVGIEFYCKNNLESPSLN